MKLVHVQVFSWRALAKVGSNLKYVALRSFRGSRFTCSTFSPQRSVITAPNVIYENEVNDWPSFLSATLWLITSLAKPEAPFRIFIIERNLPRRKISNTLPLLTLLWFASRLISPQFLAKIPSLSAHSKPRRILRFCPLFICFSFTSLSEARCLCGDGVSTVH